MPWEEDKGEEPLLHRTKAQRLTERAWRNRHQQIYYAYHSRHHNWISCKLTNKQRKWRNDSMSKAHARAKTTTDLELVAKLSAGIYPSAKLLTAQMRRSGRHHNEGKIHSMPASITGFSEPNSYWCRRCLLILSAHPLYKVQLYSLYNRTDAPSAVCGLSDLTQHVIAKVYMICGCKCSKRHQVLM